MYYKTIGRGQDPGRDSWRRWFYKPQFFVCLGSWKEEVMAETPKRKEQDNDEIVPLGQLRPSREAFGPLPSEKKGAAKRTNRTPNQRQAPPRREGQPPARPRSQAPRSEERSVRSDVRPARQEPRVLHGLPPAKHRPGASSHSRPSGAPVVRPDTTTRSQTAWPQRTRLLSLQSPIRGGAVLF